MTSGNGSPRVLAPRQLSIFPGGVDPGLLAPQQQRHGREEDGQRDHGDRHKEVLQAQGGSPGTQSEHDDDRDAVADKDNGDEGIADELFGTSGSVWFL